MAVADNHKSQDWYDGYTTAMVFLSEVFESHSKGLTEKYKMRQKDLRLVVNIIDACILYARFAISRILSLSDISYGLVIPVFFFL